MESSEQLSLLEITYDSSEQTFHLRNRVVSYVMYLEEGKFLAHQYWGKRLNKVHAKRAYPRMNRAFAPNPTNIQNFSLDLLPQEYPGTDTGDYREPAYIYTDERRGRANRLEFVGYRISEGKQPLIGLPYTYVREEAQGKTLEVDLRDTITGMEATLSYTILRDQPIVTRSVRFKNSSREELKLERALSMSMDFSDGDYELLQLPGAWARERELVRSPLVRGIHTLDSKRGTTSHSYQPFVALVRKETNEEAGEVFGFHFVYSGEFLANIEVDAYEQVRIQIGISPTHFEWSLLPGETFQTPEVVLVYSSQGLNGMSQGLHRLYQHHLMRGRYQHLERPILVNNWEGTYFDFTEDKILEMAESAAQLGIELFVLDDGWFGKRDSDTSSLGDWFVHAGKLPKGLKYLSECIQAKGMKFGLWFEPEMISEDSELYRRHPDWCLHTPGRPRSQGRNQYVLDFSRKDVRRNILQQIKTILDEVPIDYIKWDYNRNMTELGSGATDVLPGEVAHRYILGLYEVLEELVTSYPEILFESCSGGGGRYDPGMLYYMPQTWTSDNTDAVARLKIQYATSLLFPISSMGAHVSAVPNHQVNRHTSLAMRGNVAMSGNLGYELDLTQLSSTEKRELAEQINFYKEYRSLIQYGDFYRILNPFEHQNQASWIFVDQKKDTAIFFYFQILDQANKPYPLIKLAGLNPDHCYQLEDGRIFGGDELMYQGIYLNADLIGDFQSQRIVISRC